ncbi:hypothetical protein KEM56_003680 [Ascosphaera pollenicola]|nr:hypothetical protein KEM56_003680 [Ascosphaera pollenicola]
MRLSIISSAALLGVSLAVSPDPGVTATEEAQTAYITVHPDACQAPSHGPEFILPATASPSASPEADPSTLTITSTSTHVVWVTEDKTADESVFETAPPRPYMSYAPFTPPVAPLSCDDAPVLTYISETGWETLPASTVTTTSVSTTTVMVDHERNSTSTVYVTLSQTPVTVTSTATITAAPSLVTVTVTDKYTAQGPSDQTTATVIMTTANSTRTMNGTSVASAIFGGTSTSVNVVPVDSTPGERTCNLTVYQHGH